MPAPTAVDGIISIIAFNLSKPPIKFCACANKLSTCVFSDSVNATFAPLKNASSINTERVDFSFFTFTPNLALYFCKSPLPEYVVCHTTPISAFLIFLPASLSTSQA